MAPRTGNRRPTKGDARAESTATAAASARNIGGGARKRKPKCERCGASGCDAKAPGDHRIQTRRSRIGFRCWSFILCRRVFCIRLGPKRCRQGMPAIRTIQPDIQYRVTPKVDGPACLWDAFGTPWLKLCLCQYLLRPTSDGHLFWYVRGRGPSYSSFRIRRILRLCNPLKRAQTLNPSMCSSPPGSEP